MGNLTEVFGGTFKTTEAAPNYRNSVFESVHSRCDGRWREILTSNGVTLPNGKKHGPCPIHGGKDKFRFDDKQGRGTWFCNDCEPQAGDGIALYANVFGLQPLEAAQQLARIVGIDPNEPAPMPAPRIIKTFDETDKEQAKKKAERGGKRAQKVIDEYCKPAPSNQDYLARKRIKPHGAYVLSKPFKNAEDQYKPGRIYPADTLVVPIFGVYGLQSLEFIADPKRPLIGAPKKAGFFPIGQLRDANRIWITEGFADAATVFETTGEPAVCAFSAGQIPAAAEIMAKHYPQAQVCIATDNDTAGLRFAKKTGLPYAAPEQHGQDWNDFYIAGGDVKQALETAIKSQAVAPVKWLAAPEARARLSQVVSQIFTLKHPKIDEPYRCHLMKGAAGLGKTTIIVAIAKTLPKGRFIEYYCQSVAFCEEVAEKCRQAGVSARVIRGRDKEHNGKKMCRKHKAASALGKAGIPVYSSLCFNKKTKEKCPYFDACPYIDQFNGTDTVRLYPTNRLGMARGAVDKLDQIPVLAVIDESFYQVLSTEAKLDAEKIKQSRISPEAKNILDTWINTGAKPEWCDTLEDAFSVVADTFEPPALTPKCSEDEATQAAKGFKPEKAMYALLASLKPCVIKKIKGEDPAAIKVINNEKFSITGRKPINRFIYKLEGEHYQIPMLNLDASADVEVINAITGLNWELHEINAKREAVTFTHINKAFSKSELGLLDCDFKNESAKQKAEALRAAALDWVHEVAAKHERLLLITYKALAELWKDCLPDNVSIEYFGNLRGKDQYRDYDAEIQIGRFQPNPHSIQALSRSIFQTETGHKHQLERLIRDTETEQGVDRLRLIGNTKPRHVYLATNYLPASIKPDHVLSWAEAKGYKQTGQQLIEQIADKFGGVPTSAAFLSKHAPELVGNLEQAKKAVQRYIKPALIKFYSGQSSIYISIESCPDYPALKRKPFMAVLGEYCPDNINCKLIYFGCRIAESGNDREQSGTVPACSHLDEVKMESTGEQVSLTETVLIDGQEVTPPDELNYRPDQWLVGFQEAQRSNVVAELVLDGFTVPMITPAQQPLSLREAIEKARAQWSGRLNEIHFKSRPGGWPEKIHFHKTTAEPQPIGVQAP